VLALCPLLGVSRYRRCGARRDGPEGGPGLATNKGQAKAALITGAIGVVLGIISAIASAAINEQLLLIHPHDWGVRTPPGAPSRIR
jgi:hypothetical protein